MNRSVNNRRKSEQGFALLLVFLMAAIIAMMLYQQLPRVAFESEREKEQLLIDRGEQYTRAIQLYYLAHNRQYPTSIDDLEKREKRYLRRRYVDPFTGKDEWRIIHTNGGFLTDSLVQKPVDANASKSQSASNTTSNTTNSTSPADAQPQVNAAVLQRPSDRPVTPQGFEQPVFTQDPSGQQVNTQLPPITLSPQQGLPPITLQAGANQQGGLPPITLAPAGGPQGPGQNPPLNTQLNPGPGQIPGQIPGQLRPPIPGQPGPGGLPGGFQPGAPPGFRIDANGQLIPTTNLPGQIPGQGIPGQGIPGQGIPGQGVPGQPSVLPGLPPQPENTFGPGQQNGGQAGPAQGSPNTAINVINQLLTNPRQTNTTSTSPISGSNQIGAIAGIASTHKGPSIKVYKDQTKYELWEFVFNPTASTVPGGGTGIPGIAPGNGQAPGQGGQNQPGGFGGAPGGFGAPGAGPGRGAPPNGTFGQGGGQQIFGPGR